MMRLEISVSALCGVMCVCVEGRWGGVGGGALIYILRHFDHTQENSKHIETAS